MIEVNPLRSGQIGPVRTMDHGVYSAEAIAPTGEKIYMAMESLESFDREKWNRYRNMAILLTQGGECNYTIGSLTEIGSHLNDDTVLNKFLASHTFPDFWTSDSKRFEQLRDKLRDRKIALGSQKAEELKVVHHASCGMNVEKQTHVVYVSKVPITSRVNFVAQSKSFDFGSTVEKYGDLIMSVGVTIQDVVENRGIFRNPLSIVDGGYGSLAMMLHSFTCMVVKEAFPEVTTFKVRPLKKMGELFLNSLPKHLVTVNGIPGDQYNKGFDHEQAVLVPVEVLANLHT